MCTWKELVDGSLELKDLMDMHRNIYFKYWLEGLQNSEE